VNIKPKESPRKPHISPIPKPKKRKKKERRNAERRK